MNIFILNLPKGRRRCTSRKRDVKRDNSNLQHIRSEAKYPNSNKNQSIFINKTKSHLYFFKEIQWKMMVFRISINVTAIIVY